MDRRGSFQCVPATSAVQRGHVARRRPPEGCRDLVPRPGVRLCWPFTRGRGSVGRASPCQGEGRGFESRRPLQERSCSAALSEPPSARASDVDEAPCPKRAPACPSVPRAATVAHRGQRHRSVLGVGEHPQARVRAVAGPLPRGRPAPDRTDHVRDQVRGTGVPRGGAHGPRARDLVDPDLGSVLLRDYAWQWLDQKVNLRPRTWEQYELNLRRHVLPQLGDLELSAITTAQVRAWRAGLLRNERLSPGTVTKAYRLLHGMLATAVEDELVVRNPCVVRGASAERSAERPIATIPQVLALADAIDPPYRLFVLLAGFTGLRLGELRALRRDRLDLERGTMQRDRAAPGALLRRDDRRATEETQGAAPSPSRAALIPALVVHLERFVDTGARRARLPGRRGHADRPRKTFRGTGAERVPRSGSAAFGSTTFGTRPTRCRP